MIISRTPHRISFFGGGTDYPNYYMKYGGKVLGSTIDKYCYLNVRKLPPFFDHKHRIVYSSQENVNNIEDIKHPSVRETLKYLNINYGISIHHDGDIPARSGMGSSSAFTTGLLLSLLALEGRSISKEDLMIKTIDIEQNKIKENVGSQDQAFASFGGLNVIEFSKSGNINVKPIIISKKRKLEFESSVLLFYTGISRIASNIAKDQIKNTDKNIDQLHIMNELVDKAYNILIDENIDLNNFGSLLNDTWKLKKSLSKQISNDFIDNLYKRAMSAGAVGGKILGAGGGGFIMFYVEPDKQKQVISELSDLLHVPFKFEYEGSKIILYQNT